MTYEKKSNISDLTEHVIEDIKKNKIINSDGKLISEHEMMAKYNASRYAVREVLKSLVKFGLIRQKHGVGSFVRPKTTNKIIKLQDNQMSDEIINTTYLISNIQISKHNLYVSEAEFLPKNIELPLNSRLIEINNVKEMNNEECFIEKIYFLEDKVSLVSSKKLYGSIFNLYKEDKNLKIGIIDKFISSEVFSEKDIELLNIKTSSLALSIRKDIYLNTGELLCFSKEVYDSSKVEFYISIPY